jgi:hypothetical protein
MKIKSILLTLLCATALNPPAFAEYLEVTDGAIISGSGKTYESDASHFALYVSDAGSQYTGTNIIFNAPFGTGPGSYAAYVVGATLSLTGGTITTTGNYGAGVHLESNGSGTLNNVTIKAEGDLKFGVDLSSSSTLTMTGGTITSRHYGVISDNSTSKLDNLTIAAEGNESFGVHLYHSNILLTDSNISAIGDDSNAIYIYYNSTGTMSLNHNTLTGGIAAEVSSTLTLTGSNGTVITSDVSASIGYGSESDGSVVNITLSGSETKLIGTATHDAYSAINLTIEDGAQLNKLEGNINTLTLQNGATLGFDDLNIVLLLNGAPISVTTGLLTLSDGTIIDYGNSGMLSFTGDLAIGDNILVDFGGLALEEGGSYVLFWVNATLSDTVTADSFTATNHNLDPDLTGTFTVDENGLIFKVTAIPEPTTYLLLVTGLSLLLLTACRKVQS